MTPLEQTLKLLPKLKPKELREVRVHLTALLGKRFGPLTPDAQIFYDALEKTLAAEGLLFAHNRLQKSKAYNLLCENTEYVITYAQLYFRPKNKIEKMKVSQILIDILIARVRKLKLTITPLVVAQQLRNLPSMVDIAFPGYREGRLLPVLIHASKQT